MSKASVKLSLQEVIGKIVSTVNPEEQKLLAQQLANYSNNEWDNYFYSVKNNPQDQLINFLCENYIELTKGASSIIFNKILEKEYQVTPSNILRYFNWASDFDNDITLTPESLAQFQPLLIKNDLVNHDVMSDIIKNLLTTNGLVSLQAASEQIIALFTHLATKTHQAKEEVFREVNINIGSDEVMLELALLDLLSKTMEGEVVAKLGIEALNNIDQKLFEGIDSVAPNQATLQKTGKFVDQGISHITQKINSVFNDQNASLDDKLEILFSTFTGFREAAEGYDTYLPSTRAEVASTLFNYIEFILNNYDKAIRCIQKITDSEGTLIYHRLNAITKVDCGHEVKEEHIKFLLNEESRAKLAEDGLSNFAEFALSFLSKRFCKDARNSESVDTQKLGKEVQAYLFTLPKLIGKIVSNSWKESVSSKEEKKLLETQLTQYSEKDWGDYFDSVRNDPEDFIQQIGVFLSSEVATNFKITLFNNSFGQFMKARDSHLFSDSPVVKATLLYYLRVALNNYEATKEAIKSIETHLFEKHLERIAQEGCGDAVVHLLKYLKRPIKFLMNEDSIAKISADGLDSFAEFALLFMGNPFCKEASDSKSIKTQKLVKEVQEHLLSYKYAGSGFKIASTTIVSDLPNDKEDTVSYLEAYSTAYDKVIYNNNVDYSRSGYLKGAELKMIDGTPVGYNIHLPKSGQVDAVLVTVYGGNQASEKGTATNKPGVVGKLGDYLLSKNIAVISLNLVDLLELNVHQSSMPSDLHTKLHASINHFFEAIKDNPESLHSDLASLKGKKIFLQGSSFGGRTAVKQAELHPGSFDGYISHDGYLSFDMAAKADIGTLTTRAENYIKNTALSIMSDLDKIQKPIFIYHNFDDNNVNIKISLDFIQKAYAAGKGNLVQAWFSNKGNKLPTEASDVYNKGHGFPDQKTIFDGMANAIADFILKGPSKFPELTELRTQQMELLANKNYRSADLEQKFISEAFRDYKNLVKKEGSNASAKAELQKNWEQYAKLFQAIDYVENIKDYKAEITKLKQVLSNQMIDKAIKLNFNSVLECLEETGESKGIVKTFDDIKNKKSFYKAYKDALDQYSNNPVVAKYLLSNLYKANPELVTEAPSAELVAGIDHAKAELFAKLDKESNIIKSIWQKATMLVHPALASLEQFHDGADHEPAILLGQSEEAF